MSVIELSGISKLYGYGEAVTTALDGVDLKINKGEFVAIMGPSGSGKSTLLNIIGLLDTPSGGTYKLAGKSVEHISQKERAKIRREKLGFIFQSFNLLPRINVVDNVSLPLTYTGMSYVQRTEKASKILNSLGLEAREYYMPNQLSGGQVQRAAIARALVNKPAVILADEPTGNLDQKSGENIMKILTDLNKEGNTILMVTHDQHIADYAHRIIHVIDGRVTEKTVKVRKAKKAPVKKKAAKKVKVAKKRTKK